MQSHLAVWIEMYWETSTWSLLPGLDKAGKITLRYTSNNMIHQSVHWFGNAFQGFKTRQLSPCPENKCWYMINLLSSLYLTYEYICGLFLKTSNRGLFGIIWSRSATAERDDTPWNGVWCWQQRLSLLSRWFKDKNRVNGCSFSLLSWRIKKRT